MLYPADDNGRKTSMWPSHTELTFLLLVPVRNSTLSVLSTPLHGKRFSNKMVALIGIIRVSKLKRIDFFCYFSDSLYPGDSNGMHSYPTRASIFGTSQKSSFGCSCINTRYMLMQILNDPHWYDGSFIPKVSILLPFLSSKQSQMFMKCRPDLTGDNSHFF